MYKKIAGKLASKVATTVVGAAAYNTLSGSSQAETVGTTGSGAGASASAIDVNGDGQADVVEYDFNGDGAADFTAVDLDGDGIADVAGESGAVESVIDFLSGLFGG
jgi:hypothetical protein